MAGAAGTVEQTMLVIGLLWGPLVAVAGASQPTVSEQPMIGEAAPAFELEGVGGGPLSLERLRGQFVVMHFGASW